MAKYCQNCGEELNSKAKFCAECGEAIISQTVETESTQVNSKLCGSVGFSDKINDPKILESIEKRKKFSRGCAFIMIPLPLIIYLIVSFVSEEVETIDALVIGGAISFVFFLFILLSLYISSAKRGWDGVVIDKRYKDKTRRVNNGDNWEIEHYDEYVITFRTDSGKKERCVESFYQGRAVDLDYYQYLEIGDRVRYNPQLNYHYEKYDKSHDDYIPCMMCKKYNDICNDICDSCGNPLFK
ncbi:MAG: zinc-ribbon domain-containing protein [Clostridiales bacterium]|nr:zinc-ribbon domain-containing protein [Clostridiales bacterium]